MTRLWLRGARWYERQPQAPAEDFRDAIDHLQPAPPLCGDTRHDPWRAGRLLRCGGVEHYESAGDALVKELREEGNLEIIGSPRLFHIYFNRSASKRDHVLFYRVDVRQTAPRPPDREIRDCGFFPLHALPEGVTQATLRRLAELHSDLPVTAIW